MVFNQIKHYLKSNKNYFQYGYPKYDISKSTLRNKPKNGYKTYLVDECITSSKCSKCEVIVINILLDLFVGSL